MNFRQRLTNVLTVVIVTASVCVSWVTQYGQYQLSDIPYLLAGHILPFVFTAGISFLLGTGFKAWHK